MEAKKIFSQLYRTPNRSYLGSGVQQIYCCCCVSESTLLLARMGDTCLLLLLLVWLSLCWGQKVGTQKENEHLYMDIEECSGQQNCKKGQDQLTLCLLHNLLY